MFDLYSRHAHCWFDLHYAKKCVFFVNIFSFSLAVCALFIDGSMILSTAPGFVQYFKRWTLKKIWFCHDLQGICMFLIKKTRYPPFNNITIVSSPQGSYQHLNKCRLYNNLSPFMITIVERIKLRELIMRHWVELKGGGSSKW